MLAIMSDAEQSARLRFLRERAGFATGKAAADFLGVKPQTYAHHENGTRGLRPDVAKRYARRFRVDPWWLLNGPGTALPSYEPPQDMAQAAGEARRPDLRRGPKLPPLRLDQMPRDVPVYGAAQSAYADRIRFTGMADRVPRLPGIAGASDVYALYVVGTSMQPAYGPGDLIYVSPHRPVKAGDTVVVRTRNSEAEEELGFLGVLVAEGADQVTVRKHNPPAATTTFLRPTITGVHKVLTLRELIGL